MKNNNNAQTEQPSDDNYQALAKQIVTDLTSTFNNRDLLKTVANTVFGVTYLALFLTTCYTSLQVITAETDDNKTKVDKRADLLDKVADMVISFYLARFTGGLMYGLFGRSQPKELIDTDEYVFSFAEKASVYDRELRGYALSVKLREKLFHLSAQLPQSISITPKDSVKSIIMHLTRQFNIPQPILSNYKWNSISSPPFVNAYFLAAIPDQQTRDQFWAFYLLSLVAELVTCLATYEGPTKNRGDFKLVGPILIMQLLAPLVWWTGDGIEMLGAEITVQLSNLKKTCIQRGYKNTEKTPLITNIALNEEEASHHNTWLTQAEQAAFEKMLQPGHR